MARASEGVISAAWTEVSASTPASAYDIALNKAPDGSYGLTTDWWEGHVEKEVGQNYGRLLQLYGIHKTMIEARKRGRLVQRKAQRDGSIKLVIGGV